MAGRLAYFLVAGAAIVAGMVFQGDLDLDRDDAVRTVVSVDYKERATDRRDSRTVIRSEDGERVKPDRAVERALAEAVADLVRAEGSLAAAKVNDEAPAVIEQAQQRRNLARQAVEQIADDARAESRRDARGQSVRDDVRERIRDAVRS